MSYKVFVAATQLCLFGAVTAVDSAQMSGCAWTQPVGHSLKTPINTSFKLQMYFDNMSIKMNRILDLFMHLKNM